MTLSLLENMESGLATSSKSYRLLRYFIPSNFSDKTFSLPSNSTRATR